MPWLSARSRICRVTRPISSPESRVADRQGVDPKLVDSVLGLFDGHRVVDREDGASGDVDGGRRRRHLDGQGLEQKFPQLHRHQAGDPGRSGCRVAAAAELLRHPADVEPGDPGPEDQVDVGRANQHDHSDRDLEDLDPAVDDEGGLLVVAVHLDHRQGHRHAGDVHLFGGFDDLVEELELLGLQDLEDPAPDPLEASRRFPAARR